MVLSSNFEEDPRAYPYVFFETFLTFVILCVRLLNWMEVMLHCGTVLVLLLFQSLTMN